MRGMFRPGLENLLSNKKLIAELKSRRVGLVAHPASVDRRLNHAFDLLAEKLGKGLTCAFGPQHGMRGEKQDNMIESDDFKDPRYGIPVYSLYGKVRRPTPQMLDQFDLLLFDLQDVGCRIYTFLTTLFYVLDDCAKTGKAVWVLDRPNPAGRPIEGNLLEPKFFSFVGAAEIPMRHGLTLGEAGAWYIKHRGLNVEYKVVKMSGYRPADRKQNGWPGQSLAWVNPSPNLPTLSGVRVYPGTVLIEGLLLSEGRGTTRPLEIIGHPELDGEKLAQRTLDILPPALRKGFKLRPCFFEPTFHKFAGQLCAGLQIHVDLPEYNHSKFRPYRLTAAIFKAACEQLGPEKMWKNPPYEYEFEKLPIDLISGSEFLRHWVQDRKSNYPQLDKYLTKDEKAWEKFRKPFLLY